MDVVAYQSDHSHDGVSCLITLLRDEYGDLHGFECEPIQCQMMEGQPVVGATSCALNDLRIYDFIEAPPSSTQNTPTRRFRTIKKLLRSLLQRKSNSITKSPRSAKEYHQMLEGETSKKYSRGDDSDCDTIATSASISENSWHVSKWLEDFVVNNSEGAITNNHNRSSVPPVKTKSSEPNIVEIWSNPENLLRDYFGRSEADKIQVSKAHELVFEDDATACTATSDASSLSSCSTTDPKSDVSLMEQRLLGTGKVTRDDFDFVPDYVSKEVLHLVDEEKKVDIEEDCVSHVKTGIWEVTSFEDDGRPKETYYIVTGVSMDDRVDMKKLRKYVFAGEQHRRRPKIDMAATDIAEGLAGYRSGTMAPICHTHNMKLFLEESLLSQVDLEKHRLNVGSGMFGKCLSISPKKLLAIAEANPKGHKICPIIRTAKK